MDSHTTCDESIAGTLSTCSGRNSGKFRYDLFDRHQTLRQKSRQDRLSPDKKVEAGDGPLSVQSSRHAARAVHSHGTRRVPATLGKLGYLWWKENLMRGSLVFGVLWLVATQTLAGDPAPKTILDEWDAAYLPVGKVGYVRTLVQEHSKGGQKSYVTLVSLHLTLKRFKDVINLSMDTGTTETADGKVTATYMRQYLGEKLNHEIRGVMKDGELHLSDRGTLFKKIPWKDGVLGLYRQKQFFKDKTVKPGDSFEYLSFEPALSDIVPIKVKIKAREDAPVFGGNKKRLLRVEATPGKVQDTQLPTNVLWFDDTMTPLRSQTDMPGLGDIVMLRTTKEYALAPGLTATLTDIGISQNVKLKQKITNAYAAKAAVYRITLKKDDDAGTAFSRDDRQQVKNLKGRTFELHVRSSQGPKEGRDEKAKAEFTQSSYFINCDDPLVKQHARAAVGKETDAWKKALSVEKWVNERMTPVGHEALAPADHVAQTLKGDCTEFAMLTAAMCRAEGVPSRTAVGLIYATLDEIPVFAFHMWTEVWIRGQWVPLDATLGRGYVGATHLKISDQSWHQERTLAPLLPVLRVVGQVQIEILKAE
jgi:hypothetical protein